MSDVTDDLEKRVTFLEAAREVDTHRVHELEAWRRRDEPHTLALVNDATVADQVRKALNEHSTRSWSRWQKVAVVVGALTTFAGGVASLLSNLGVI